MKSNYLLKIIFCLFVCSFVWANRAQVETIEMLVKKGEVHQGVSFPEGTRLTLIKQNKAVVAATLSQEFKISGLVLKKGTSLQIWDDGSLFEFEPLAGQTVGDMSFQEQEATLRFAKGGVLESVYLKKAKTLQGYQWESGYHVEFHPNGKIARGTLAAGNSKAGLVLKEKSELRLYPSGQIQSAKLASDSQYEKFTLKGDPNPGETQFWSNGKLREAILAKDFLIDSYECGPGKISFFETGHLQTLHLAKDRKIVLNPYAGQAPVEKEAHAGDQLTLNEKGIIIGWGSSK